MLRTRAEGRLQLPQSVHVLLRCAVLCCAIFQVISGLSGLPACDYS